MPVSRGHRIWVWLAGLVMVVGLLWLLSRILLPFAAGMAIAYVLDPLARRIERLGLSRALATVVITLGFFLVAVAAIFLLMPLIENQIVVFLHRLPDIGQSLARRAEPLWQNASHYLSAQDMARVQTAAGDYAGTVVRWLATFFSRLVTGSLVVVNVLSLIFITPVVTFYMLRDWGKLVGRVNGWLPRDHAATIRNQMTAIDLTLAGFARGQALVCLSLGLFYAVALTAVGLDLGLVVGFAAGVLSFIPYLGTISGFIAGIGLAMAQAPDWTLPLVVAGVFVVGNVLEGYVLSPKLVGDKIGLHPVWVMFALLAGGALFGFLGLLLALPVAAVVGVLARFSLERYLASPYYRGDTGGDGI